MGSVYQRLGRFDEAITYFGQSLTITRTRGYTYKEAQVLWGLAQTHHALGNQDQARAFWRDSITILGAIGELSREQAAQLRDQPIPRDPAGHPAQHLTISQAIRASQL